MAEPLTTDAPDAASDTPPASPTTAAAPTPAAVPGAAADELPGLPMPYAVYAAIRERAGEETAPLVDRLLRHSLVLVPATDADVDADAVTATGAAPGVEADAGAGSGADPTAGQLGGLPALPAGTGWPEFAGRPMQFLAQLDCAGLAASFRATAPGGDWPLPDHGLLLFFHDEWLSDFSGRGCRVLHVPAGSAPRPAPEQDSCRPAVPAVPVRARWELSAPSYQDRELENLFPDDFMIALDLAADFRDHLPSPDVRVLGWCDTDTGRPAEHRPLLQIENAALDVDWGECVNVSFWITGEDLAAGRFDRARHGFEIA
ncbi:YwqG family protein [Kitasatospora sp. CM 4170]|uniref:YwqG family protein n=1 Tax=Kitasatospora aburaviensis TaxID=67265 RepID=A0ABW1FAN7_9ACTN|nr:YwqG family protein [Kitasatospora sp. CM 4170]WNM49381.1 YwqG family protein [Kitasatospora sp. CM 4170]